MKRRHRRRDRSDRVPRSRILEFIFTNRRNPENEAGKAYWGRGRKSRGRRRGADLRVRRSGGPGGKGAVENRARPVLRILLDRDNIEYSGRGFPPGER